MNAGSVERLLDRLAQQPFRARFTLSDRDRQMIAERGMPVVRTHAVDLISRRLAPAAPPSDGKQTPYRGHPVFVAQHATATCCRSCLTTWHHIPAGRELTAQEQAYVIDVLGRWLRRRLER